MSGESSPRATAGAEPLERAFGPRATCNTCGAVRDDYRVVALFLHDTVIVRSYCERCYPAAADGDYHAGGTGLLLGYHAFAERFGAPGPPPPPATPVDRMLASLMRDPSLRVLSPGTEAIARRRRQTPYPVLAGFAIDGTIREARMALTPAGQLTALTGDPAACARVRELIGG